MYKEVGRLEKQETPVARGNEEAAGSTSESCNLNVKGELQPPLRKHSFMLL